MGQVSVTMFKHRAKCKYSRTATVVAFTVQLERTGQGATALSLYYLYLPSEALVCEMYANGSKGHYAVFHK